MEDRNAMERMVAVRVAALVVVVGLLVGIGQGAFSDHGPKPQVAPEPAPVVAATPAKPKSAGIERRVVRDRGVHAMEVRQAR